MSLEQLEENLLKGRNIFLTGAGGTGKTFLLREMLKKYPANFVVTSSTGISAMGLFEGARTIHSFSTVGTSSNEDFPTSKSLENHFGYMKEKDRCAIVNTKRLIIEEISMISASQLNLIDRVFRLTRKCNKIFGGVQVIIAGDFLQIPSVSKKDETPNEYAFQSRAWKEAKLVTIYLNEVKRTTDKDFAAMLLRIRTINHTATDFKLMKSLENTVLINTPVSLVATNRKADNGNAYQLEKLEGIKLTFYGKFRGPRISIKEDFKRIREGLLCPHTLELKVGCRVMITANERKYEGDDSPVEYVNGSLGTFIKHRTEFTSREFKQFEYNEETGLPIKGTEYFDRIAYDVLDIKLDTGKFVNLKRMSWTEGELIENAITGKQEFEIEYKQFPVRLAYAVTIHKAQGLSIDSLEVDCDGIFADSQFYVAVSRATSLEGLKIRNLKGKYIKANVDALEFYKNLEIVK